MTTFVNNDVQSGNIIYAADHNEQGARVAAVLNGGIGSANIAAKGVALSNINGGASPGPIQTDVSGVVSVPSGGVIQIQSASFNAVATGTTTIPNDDTIPQITEGNEYMTLSFTPKSTTSKLRIEATAMLSHTSGTSVMSVALFKDATANALAAVSETITAGVAPATIKLDAQVTSGSTSAITFRIRCGAHTAGTTTFNGFAGGRMFGDIQKSSIVITEISA